MLEIAPDDQDALSEAGLDSFDALMSAKGEASLHKKGLASWRERVVMEVGGRRLFLKRYARPPLGEQLRGHLRGFDATARVEWHWLRELARLGIRGPRMVAFGFRRRGLLEEASLLLTEAVRGCSLEQWVRGEGAVADRAHRARVAEALARLVADLHGARVIHRDLYLSHVFIDDGERVDLALIDLQRMMRPRLRWRRWVVKDLAALNYSTPAAIASSADRLRWWKRYRGSKRLSARDKATIRAILRKTRRIARHSARHGLG